MLDFVKIKKDNILTDEEFESMHAKDQKVIIFEANSEYAKPFFMNVWILKLIYTTPFLFTIIYMTGKAATVSATSLGVVALVNVISAISIKLQLRQWRKQILFAIHYNTATRKLETVYFDQKGSHTIEVDPKDIEVIPESLQEIRKQQNIESKLKEGEKAPSGKMITSIYRDTKNNIDLRTIETGKWYNQDLWLYFMTKNTEGKQEMGQWTEK